MFAKLDNWGNRTALVSEEGLRLTYSELALSSLHVVEKLTSGRICFLLCSNNIAAVEYYIGLIRKKVSTFLIPPNTSTERLRELIEAYSPDYIISPTPNAYKSYKVIGQNRDFYIFENNYEEVSKSLEKTALCLTTSGSTGTPRFVMLSKENIESNTNSIIEVLAIDENQKTITTMPMHYSYGLSVINTALEAGGTVTLNTKTVDSKEFWDLVIRDQVNTLSGVPFIYEQLSRITSEFLSKTAIRKFTQAGGRLDQKVRTHFDKICKETGINFYSMYGQTEASARISVLPPSDFSSFENSIGFPIPGGKLSVVDSLGRRITEARVIGELVYEGPNVFQGYATCRQDLVGEHQPEMELHTGDLGFFDEEFRFYISGRMKRMAKILGHRINLEEVELYLAQEGLVSCCLEYGRKLLIVFTENAEPEEIKKKLYRFLDINYKLIETRQVEFIPRLENGKVDYASILRSVEEF